MDYRFFNAFVNDAILISFVNAPISRGKNCTVSTMKSGGKGRDTRFDKIKILHAKTTRWLM